MYICTKKYNFNGTEIDIWQQVASDLIETDENTPKSAFYVEYTVTIETPEGDYVEYDEKSWRETVDTPAAYKLWRTVNETILDWFDAEWLKYNERPW